MPTPARERRRLAPETRRAQILEAAFRVFAERGYHSARMDDLVRESGLSKGSLYWHFDSKEDVFLALFDALEAAILAEWEREEADHAASALAALRCDAEVVLERMSGQRVMMGAWMEFLGHPAARDRMQLAYERSRSRAAELLRRGIASGEIRTDLPVAETAALLTGAIEGLVLQTFVNPDFDAVDAWDGAWPVLQRGIEQ